MTKNKCYKEPCDLARDFILLRSQLGSFKANGELDFGG